MAPRCCLGWCAVGTLVVVGALVLVTVYVIVPDVAQKTLNDSELVIRNSTIFLETLESPSAMFWNDMTIQTSSPFPATIHSFNVSLEYDDVVFASFTFPKETLSHGLNEYKFQGRLLIHNIPNMTAFSMALMTNHSMKMSVVGKPKVTALGIPAHPTQNKTVWCNLIQYTMPGNLTLSMDCSKDGDIRPTTTTTTTQTISVCGCTCSCQDNGDAGGCAEMDHDAANHGFCTAMMDPTTRCVKAAHPERCAALSISSCAEVSMLVNFIRGPTDPSFGSCTGTLKPGTALPTPKPTPKPTLPPKPTPPTQAFLM